VTLLDVTERDRIDSNTCAVNTPRVLPITLGGTYDKRMGYADADVIEYIYWGRNIRGLADTTLRVRMDVLLRLHAYIDTPLRQAAPGQLLRFERAAIAGRSPETRRAYCCHIRAFYRWAVQTGIVTDDPSVMLTLPKVPKHLPRPIAEDDLTVALAAARPKMRAMLTLAAFGGLRCVEIAALDWTDLRREADGSAYLHVHGKGGRERTVEIGETVVRALQGFGIKRRGPLFLGQDGQRMSARSVSHVGNHYLKRNGIEAGTNVVASPCSGEQLGEVGRGVEEVAGLAPRVAPRVDELPQVGVGVVADALVLVAAADEPVAWTSPDASGSSMPDSQSVPTMNGPDRIAVCAAATR
jgi:site-specific recombinase XerD